MKALGFGLGYFSLCDIEVLHDPNGKPCLKLHGRAEELTRGDNVLVSISHTGDLACAQVIVENGGL